MAYRNEAGEVCEAPTAEGVLRAELAPRHVVLAVANRSIEIVDAFATVVEHHRKHRAQDRRSSFRIAGRLVVARDVPRGGMGVWVELEPGGPRAGFRRIFGVDPVSLLDPAGLAALAALDRLTGRLRHAVTGFAHELRRATELGSSASGGLDKVLFTEHADRCAVYARRLFRDRARLVLEAYNDGRIVVRDGGGAPREVSVRSRHGILVVGDSLKLNDPHGTDLARVSIPWITFEDRVELAQRIGQRIDHAERDDTAWPPRLAADAGAEPDAEPDPA